MSTAAAVETTTTLKTELENVPKCHSCGASLVLRDPEKYTFEVAFCGTWYDHPVIPGGFSTIGHTRSYLYESDALKAQNADLASEARKASAA